MFIFLFYIIIWLAWFCGMYYRLISSLDRLVGDEGMLRLPQYIFDDYVMDEERREGIERCIEILRRGGRVLIYGVAGAGKTAMMAIVLRRMWEMGYRIGYIVDGSEVLDEHEDEGVILFYDDIPRMSSHTLQSIVRNNVGMIIATARMEEYDLLSRKLGLEPTRVFSCVRISPMSDEDLREILIRFAYREGIHIDRDAVDIVVSKAEGLPVYIWQVIRDLKINRKDYLDVDFASRIPEGMLDYVDDILWRIMGDDPERKEALLTLLIMADMPEYKMHQDLFNAVFAEAKEAIYGKKATIKEIILSDLLDRVCRYLARTQDYSFKLPHDAWRDVLVGRSRGLMSGEISRINSAFPEKERREILRRAVERAYREIVRLTKDEERRIVFLEQVERLFPSLLEELLGGEMAEERIVVGEKPIEEAPKRPPEEIVVEEEEFPGTYFTIAKERKLLGLMLNKFVIMDENGKVLAYANIEYKLLGSVVRIFDKYDNNLWRIEISGNKARMLDEGGRLMGVVEKKWFAREYLFKDRYGILRYKVRRKNGTWFIFDEYNVPAAKIYPSKDEDNVEIITKIDPKIAISITMIINIIK